MEKITLMLKNQRKSKALLEVLEQLDFVEVLKPAIRKNGDKYDFFKSAGIWKKRSITAEELRKKAWKRNP